MCLAGEHAFIRDGAILYCAKCGDVNHLTPAQKAKPQRQPRPRAKMPAPPPVQAGLFDDAPASIDEDEAAIVDAARQLARREISEDDAFARITSRYQVPEEPPRERVPVDEGEELGPHNV